MALENDAAVNPILQKSPIAPWVRAVLLSWCVIAIASQLAGLMLTCHVIPGRGSIGQNWWNFGEIRNPRSGYKVAAQPLPASPLAKAGVVAGDELRFDRRSDWFRQPVFGERIGLTIRRDGRLQHRSVVAESDRIASITPEAVIPFFTALITSALGLLIVLRTKDWPAATMFGASLASAIPAFLFSASLFPPVLFAATYLIPTVVNTAINGFGAIYFVIAWLRPDNYRPSPREWVIIGCFVMANTLREAVKALHYVTLDPALAQPFFQLISAILTYLTLFVFFWIGWRASSGRQRSRTTFFILVTFLYTICALVNTFFYQIAASLRLDQLIFQLTLNAVVGILAPGLLAYSILVDRVFDIGFVINRTLVFAVLSTLLLVAFGIIEWAVDHFIPVGWRETNVLFDAGLAVVVFLTFHRVRDAAENAIQAVFFRRWQRQEAALRRFVREASFARQPQNLTDGFAAALSRYSDGADASVYLLRADSDYGLVAHTGRSPPPVLDPDDPLIMSIRADPRPQKPDGRGSILAGVALITPMVNRNEVIGFAVLESKASQREFRSDEIELIDWATRQIGLDLHALKVEGLEGETSDLRKEVSTLRSLLDRSLIVGSASLRTTPDPDIGLAPLSGQANVR